MEQLPLMGRQRPRFRSMAHFKRTELDRDSWVDWCPEIVEGHETLFSNCKADVPWESQTRVMYDRVVEVPRLLSFMEAEQLPFSAIVDAKAALERRYRTKFGTVGFAYYRNGQDSVAWHRDQELREADRTIVAIISLGSPRKFLLRPFAQAAAQSRALHSFSLGWGDLLVMGGHCQSDWEHAVPKMAQAGPRMSIVFRGIEGSPKAVFPENHGHTERAYLKSG